MMNAYIIPTPRQRLIALGKALLPPFGGATIFLTARLYDRNAADLPLCKQLPWMWVVVVMATMVVASFAYLCGRSAFRIWRSGQYPAPGTSVLFRTRVHTGWWARTNAIAYAMISLLLAAFLVALLSMFVFPEGGMLNLGLRGCEP
jgi:hypothetical protein